MSCDMVPGQDRIDVTWINPAGREQRWRFANHRTDRHVVCVKEFSESGKGYWRLLTSGKFARLPAEVRARICTHYGLPMRGVP